jgi:integrase/recombinase XerD
MKQTNDTDIRKIQTATDGLGRDSYNALASRVLPQNRGNAITICDYVTSMKHEVNLSDNYRNLVILSLCRFSLFFKNEISFKDMTRDDLLSHLDHFRKPENVDPLHKWIGAYNIDKINLARFFKWLYSPDMPPETRPKPLVIQNIPQIKRREPSIYKPTDMWSPEDDALFLKYCSSPRDRCYHAMTRDTAARPHELLKLKIKDIVFKLTPEKRQYAEVTVNGKTGPRSIPLIDSIPYIKDWINQHPQSGNNNSILLCGLSKSLGRVLNTRSLGTIYQQYKTVYFPKILDDPNVPEEDKHKIRELLLKPWNPYVRRHSSLTQKSGILKEHHLRQFAGWSMSSKMPQKYIHYFGNESSDSLLEASGIIPNDKKQSDVLKSKQCPNCTEPNKRDSKFCTSCHIVLTYDSYAETLELEQKKDYRLQTLEEQLNFLKEKVEVLDPPKGKIRSVNHSSIEEVLEELITDKSNQDRYKKYEITSKIYDEKTRFENQQEYLQMLDDTKEQRRRIHELVKNKVPLAEIAG